MYHKLLVYCLISFFSLQTTLARAPISGDRYGLLSGVQNNKRNITANYLSKQAEDLSTGSPAWFLAENYQYIPAGGKVLDIRLRGGQNAIFLARKGYRVSGVETNNKLLNKAKMLAKEFDVKLRFIEKSIHHFKGKINNYDAVISFHFLNRKLIKKILTWIKPGGVLIIEGHTTLNKDLKDFDNIPDDYFLREGELLKLFKRNKILKYEEPMHLKTFTASIIIQKR